MADESRLRANLRTPVKFVGLGEVLFDVFEDGTATLGGAPLNVAVHVHQLASALGVGEGFVVSRVGNDSWGKKICDSLLERGMSTRYIQTDPVHGTGTVSVFMCDGEPGYQIERDAAWDFIEADPALDELAASCDAVCFGSLAQRSAKSRQTVRAFLESAKHSVRLYDVNLRRNTVTQEPGYSAQILERGCEIATIVKVNSAELVEISALFGIETSAVEEDEIVPELANGLMSRFAIPSLIVTRGAKGTALYTEQGEFRGRVPLVTLEDVHPVGAGDACTAGILFGSVLGFSPDAAVDLGNRMGAWVASYRTATPKLSNDMAKFAAELARSLDAGEGGPLGETA